MAVYVFLTDGFEETEALTTVDILRRAEADTVMVSLTGRRMVTGSHGIAVEADALFTEADMTHADMLVLPGGAVIPGYQAHRGLADLLARHAKANRLVAAICAAPTLLAELGLLDGRVAVCYPALANKLTGARHGQGAVVRDGNIITSKCAGTTVAFALALVEALRGEEAAETVRQAFAGE